MPVRDGRWVSPATIEAERQAAKAAAALVAEVEPAAPEAPQAKRSPRSRKAAATAIAKATGVEVSLDADITEEVTSATE